MPRELELLSVGAVKVANARNVFVN